MSTTTSETPDRNTKPGRNTEPGYSGKSGRDAKPTLRYAAAKVPEIGIVFWVLKLISTGMGEAMSDALGDRSVPLAAAVGIFGMTLAIWLQLRQNRYRAGYYWFAVMMVAVFGTMAADGIHDGLGTSYYVTTPRVRADHRADLLALAPLRGHALNPLDRHAPPRALLLVGGARYIRLWHRRRRSHRHAAELGILALGSVLRGGDRDPGRRLGAVQVEPDPLVLVRIRDHTPARRLFRRRLQQEHQRRPELGDPLVSLIAFVVFAAIVARMAVTGHDIQTPASVSAHPHLPHVELGMHGPDAAELEPAD